jgi:hypothetical protein
MTQSGNSMRDATADPAIPEPYDRIGIDNRPGDRAG